MQRSTPHLPLPTTATGASKGLLRIRGHKTTLAGVLVFFSFCFIYMRATSVARTFTIDVAELERILELQASDAVVLEPGTYEGPGLTPLGLEADESFRLGNTTLSDYRSELEDFVTKAFPQKYHNEAIRSIRKHLAANAASNYDLIPHKIWQTAAIYDPNIHPEWKSQPGFEYNFINDQNADKYMSEHFAGSGIHWTWNRLPDGILRSDFLRYILVLFEGGVYTDTDTRIIQPFESWGEHPIEHNPSPGPPSLIVGIEADVGTRRDWHHWWPRPLQICQWTIAGASMHPILIDTIRRVYEKNLEVEKWRKSHDYSDKEADKKIAESIKTDEAVGSVMEWTGPGVFTDAVIRNLAAAHKVVWPQLRNMQEPNRFRELVVLPVTGFSPGVGMFDAGEITSPQAMVQHYFEGSWKHKNLQ